MTHKIRQRVIAPNVSANSSSSTSSTLTTDVSTLQSQMTAVQAQVTAMREMDTTQEVAIGLYRDGGGVAIVYRQVKVIAAGPNGIPTTYPVTFSAFHKLLHLSGALQNASGDYIPLPYVEETDDGTLPDCINMKLIASAHPAPPDSIQLTPVAGTDWSLFVGQVVIEYTKVATA